MLHLGCPWCGLCFDAAAEPWELRVVLARFDPDQDIPRQCPRCTLPGVFLIAALVV